MVCDKNFERDSVCSDSLFAAFGDLYDDDGDDDCDDDIESLGSTDCCHGFLAVTIFCVE